MLALMFALSMLILLLQARREGLLLVHRHKAEALIGLTTLALLCRSLNLALLEVLLPVRRGRHALIFLLLAHLGAHRARADLGRG